MSRTDAELITLHVKALRGNAQDYREDAITYETFTRRARALWDTVPRHLRDQVTEAISIRPCGVPSLCPDDVIRPCTREAGHDGFHDGGVR